MVRLPVLLLAAAALVAGDAAEPPRQALISVMSWYTPLGALNGVRMWKKDGQGYAGARANPGGENWRWPQPDPPAAPLVPGSPACEDAQEAAARADLALIGAAGFDVALFCMAPWPRWDEQRPLAADNAPLAGFTTFQRWLRAAAGTPVRMGLFPDIANQSGDHPQRVVPDPALWTRLLHGALAACGDQPALWRVDGRPAVFHFGTSGLAGNPIDKDAPGPDQGWRTVLAGLRAAGDHPYFIADIRPHDPERAAWDGLVDAVHCFAPAGPGAFMAEMQTLMHRRHRVPYVWGVSPGYYRNDPRMSAWVAPDFRRFHDGCRAALAAGARYWHVMTWNDFGEDTDIAPSAFKGRCLLDVASFYARWFKAGRAPEAWREQIIVGYPRAIPARVGARSVVWGTPAEQRAKHWPEAADLAANPGWGDWREPPYHPAMIWWAHLDRPRTLAVAGVGTVALPAGLSLGTVGTVAAGELLATCDGAAVALPAVRAVADERAGGLQYRFHDLLRPDGRER